MYYPLKPTHSVFTVNLRPTGVTYPDGKQVSCAFNGRDQLAAVSFDGSPVATYELDNGGRISNIAFANGAQESRQYRSDNTLRAMAAQTADNQSITALQYIQDANKRRTAEVDGLNSLLSNNYGYDKQDQLTAWARTDGRTGAWNLSLGGDWNSVTYDGVTETRTHDAAHELLSRNAQPLTYDPRGNLLTDNQGRVYAWDMENRLQSITPATLTDGSQRVDFIYDTQWRRVALKITWDEADGIKQRAVRRGLARRQLADLHYVCVDEKAVGHGHDYVTIVTGVVAGKPQVLYVGDGRSEEGLNGFWELLGPEGCGRIKAVSMDMGQPYQNSTRQYCKDAELIFDPFHIMKMLNKAVDEVRRQEILFGTGAERTALKKTRQMWLWGEENLPERHAARFEELKQSTLKTARAWGLKELWRTFKRCLDADDAAAFFKKWYALAMKSKLDPVKKVARSLKEHLDGIVSIFRHGFCNALAEGVNSRIQLLVQKACGYRNRERLKTDILFHFGGLNLNPHLAQ